MPLSLEAFVQTKEERDAYVRKVVRMVFDEVEEQRAGKLKNPKE